MKIVNNPLQQQWPSLCQRPQMELDFLESSVKNILARVKKSGDQALKEITAQFDKVILSELELTPQEIEEAVTRVPENLKEAIRIASRNIEKFHIAQRKEVTQIETMPGVLCWRKGVAIEKVGIYIPGGSAPLFSTVLMLGIPAQLAGCKEIIMCSPPNKDGQLNAAIIFAAQLVGIKRIFKLGGAQAIAAMAYGTATLPSVNKIFGPGNQYVTKAKQIVNQEGIAIDMPAGPSEVMVIADVNANPSFVAADLLSQAEHGADSQVVVVTTSEEFVKKVLTELDIQIEKLPRKAIAKEALLNSVAVIFESTDDIISFANQYAPEHLRGTALTIYNSIGFSISTVSLIVIDYVFHSTGFFGGENTFLFLGVGALLGLPSMIRLIRSSKDFRSQCFNFFPINIKCNIFSFT